MEDKKQERLEKKRIAERKRKARIKSDPVLREEFRRKDRQRYYLRKDQNKILPLYEMPLRTRKKIQKEKKIYNLNYYQIRKAKQAELRAANNDANDETSCSSNTSRNSPVFERSDSNVSSNISRISRRDSGDPLNNSHSRGRRTRNCHDCISPGMHSRSLLRPLRSNGTQSNNSHPDNPLPSTSKNRHTSSPLRTPPLSPLASLCTSSIHSPQSTIATSSPNSDTSDVPKRILYNKLRRYQKTKSKEILILQRRIVELRQEKNAYRKKSERLQKIVDAKERTNNNFNRNTNKTSERIGGNAPVNPRIRNIVINFYNDDENSQISPGKNDFITRNKLKKQKRYHRDSLLNLHRKYLSLGYPPISYSTFCRMKPFWIMTPSLDTRNTCLCQKHENMELLIASLKRNKIINEKNTTDLLDSLCCNKNNVKCLLRQCEDCRGKTVFYHEFDNSNSIIYWRWEKTTKVYVRDNVEKTANAIEKVRHVAKPRQVIYEIFEKSIDPFLKHCGNIKNQSNTVKTIKQNITETECIVHIDYSENYSTKYESEIQSVHFGASRQQLTLHTAVIYFRCPLKDSIQKQSFCTVSTSLRHDASAVWAHLVPILSEIEKISPNISTLHMVSDSPSAQYRNKKIFYIISQLSSYCPSLDTIIWHYCECGHGKGAPDGVGGFLKRTADQLVAFGNDITGIDSLIQCLKTSTEAVKIERVEDHEIIEKDWLIPNDLKPFPGTMSVHQVIWNKRSFQKLALRSLSCTETQCLDKAISCNHGKHLGFYTLNRNDNVRSDTNKDITAPDHSAENITIAYQTLTDRTPLSSRNIPSSAQNVNLSHHPAALCSEKTPTIVNRFKGADKFVLNSVKQTSNPDSSIIKQYYDFDVESDLETAVIPNSSFFENIDSRLFSKYEKSRDSILQQTGSSDEENIDQSCTKPRCSAQIEYSDSDLDIF